MSPSAADQVLELAVGVALVSAFVVLWRRDLVAIVRALAVQGAALAAVAVVLGLEERDPEPLVVAALLLALKSWLLPRLVLRMVGTGTNSREAEPIINVPASLLAGAALTLVAYGTTRSVVALGPGPEAAAIPLGVAIVLIAMLVLSSRRKAVSQIVGFLLLDNGIELVALLATSGIPLVVELGVALDVVLAVLILQVLGTRMRSKFGALDLDLLRELRD
jgi:hydrogenase-4 component E